MRQFVLPPSWSGEEDLVLTGGEHHYLSRVLRLSPGIEFPALDSAGRRFDCRILSMDSESTSVKIRPQNKKVPEADFQLSLILGIPRGKKMDQVVRQATECGVRRIVPFLSDHSSVRLEPGDFRRKQERWKKVAREALQQSGTGIPPGNTAPHKAQRPESNHQGPGYGPFFSRKTPGGFWSARTVAEHIRQDRASDRP